MPDIEIAVAVLRPRIQAALRKQSEPIEGTIVEAVAECVTGSERQPLGKPLGQGRLQAVVVGMGIVSRLVDKVQVGELGGVGTVAIARGIDLIEVEKTSQPVAVIADIANL